MNAKDFDAWLDSAARELPSSIEPGRDLWPHIATTLDNDSQGRDAAASPFWSRFGPFVAGIAATLVVAVLTGNLRTDAPVPTAQSTEPAIVLEQPATWVPEIRRARTQLAPDYRTGLEALPPETRTLVESNLAQIHESLAQIHEALAADPGNLTLHRLLAATYQQEIELISTIGTITPPEQGL